MLLNQVKNSTTEILAEGRGNMEWVMEEDSYDHQFWLLNSQTVGVSLS